MKKSVLPIVLFLCIILGSCSNVLENRPSGEFISVYRLIRPEYQKDGDLLRAENLSLNKDADAVQSAVYALSSTPDDKQLMCAIPKGIKILKAKLSGLVVSVWLSESYLELTEIEQTTTDYAITLTMCSLPEVEYVSICVGNDVIKNRLRADDVVLKNTIVSPLEGEIRLFFPRTDGLGLDFEYRKVILDEANSAERQVIDELQKGPTSGKLRASLPKDTVVLSIYTQDGLCSVSFSQNFLSADGTSTDDSRLAVYSIVNSLTSLSGIDKVMILIEGKQVQSVGGVDISHPLSKTS